MGSCVMLCVWVLLLVGWVHRGGGVSCYTDVELTEDEYCPKYDGWETCYTTYDKEGKTTGRGCSKKDFICTDENSVKSKRLYGFMSSRRCPEQEKIYIHDCENIMNEDQFERVCYCRYRLCNNGYSTYYGGGEMVRLDKVMAVWLLLVVVVGIKP